MGRPRLNPDKPSTTDRLIGSAERAFARFGFVGARLEDIAKSVGITRPSLLYHFGSKASLYERVVTRGFGILRRRLEEAIHEGGTFRELLDRLLAAYLDFLHAHPDLAAVLLNEVLRRRIKKTDLMVREVVPVLDWIERVLIDAGEGVMRAGVPVRAAILQVSAAALVQHTAGHVGEAIWGTRDRTADLVRLLFLDSCSPEVA